MCPDTRDFDEEILSDVKNLLVSIQIPEITAENLYQDDIWVQGTGILLNEVGHVLTASHVVHDRPVERGISYLPALPYGFLPARVIRLEEDLEDYDLAIILTNLKSSVTRIKFALSKEFDYSIEIPLEAITFFPGTRKPVTQDCAIIPNVPKEKYNRPKPRHEDTFRVSHFVTNGNSGSPVFTRDYRKLVGITFATEPRKIGDHQPEIFSSIYGLDIYPNPDQLLRALEEGNSPFGYGLCTKLAHPDITAKLGKYL